MKVVIIAAGRSKRIKPIEDKNFLPFLGKPLIQHQLEQLASIGLKDIIIVGGAHNLQKLKNSHTKIVEQKNLEDGMAGAILSVEKYIKDQPYLLISSNDVVEKEAYLAILKAAKNKNSQSCLLAKKISGYFPGGYLKTLKNGLITKIIEKPLPGTEPSNLVNIVIHYHQNPKNLFEILHKIKSKQDDRYESALNEMIKTGVKMEAVSYSGFWQAIKYPWHVLDLMNFFLEKKLAANNKAEVAKSAIIKGKVYLEGGVKIFDNAVIIGPAYIGKNTVIATNTLIRSSQIGENCVIGFGSEITRSYIGNDVWTHRNYIGDSIVGNNVSFGAGTVTGNLRFDEENIKIKINGEKVDSKRKKFGIVTGDNIRCGINTSFMPGVKIGSNTFIGAGIIVAQDIEAHKYVYGKTRITTKENNIKLLKDRFK